MDLFMAIFRVTQLFQMNWKQRFLIFLHFLKTLKLEEIKLVNICKIMPMKMIFLSIPSEC